MRFNARWVPRLATPLIRALGLKSSTHVHFQLRFLNWRHGGFLKVAFPVLTPGLPLNGDRRIIDPHF